MPVAILAGALGVDWVLTHLAEVAAVAGGSGVLAVAASVALLRWADRRDSRRAELWAVREVAGTGTAVPISAPEHPAIVYRDVHLHLGEGTTAEQIHIIRQAIGGDL